jgi:hypothetical protein
MKIVFLFCYILNIFFLMAEERNNTGKTLLKWKRVDKAISYKIEIQSEAGKSKTLIEKNTEVYLDLNQGKYNYRIGAINKLGKVKTWSSWEPLNIIYTREPDISEKRYKLILPSKEKEIVIYGDYFLEEIELNLFSSFGKVEFKNFRRISEKELRFEIPLENAKEDNIKLVLKNPLNKSISVDNYISLIEPVPEVEKNLQYKINLPIKEKEIILRGNNFSDSIELKLKGSNGEIPFKDLTRISSKELKLKLPLDGLKEDKIQLTLKNSEKKFTILENFIELTELNTSEVAEAKNSKRSEKLNSELWPPLWRSMIFPGFGQYHKQEYTKATIFAGSTMILLGAVYYFDQEKKAASDRSERISNRLFFLPGESNLIPAAIYLRNQSLSFSNDAEEWNRKQEIGLGLLVGLYAYNLFDIVKNHNSKPEAKTTGFYFNGSVGRVNSNLYFGYTFDF